MILCASVFSQSKSLSNLKLSSLSHSETYFADSTKPTTRRTPSIGGIFFSIGTGISVPLQDLRTQSNVTFGLLGRVEYSSTSIFPIVIGGEVTYFSFAGADEFKTTNLLTSFTTKILGLGLNIEYSLARIFKSSYTIPFITIDVKTNSIKRTYDENSTLVTLPRTESRVSVGAGVGFTLFVLDFYAKYNYLKELSNVTVYTKIKFPVIRF